MNKVPVLRSRVMRWVAAIVVLSAAAAIIGARTLGRSADPMAGIPIFPVVKGPLTISITESGTVRSRQQEVLKCEVEGGSTILSIIPEGTRVKKGDLLIELDGSKMVDQSVVQEIVVKNAQAALIAAEENLEVAKNQALSDILKAELDARFALEDLVKYKEGDYKTDLKDKQSKINLAKETLQQAENKYKWSKELFDAKFISESERQSDELALKSAGLQVETAQNALDLLQNFTYKRTIAQMETTIQQTKLALERVQRKATADRVQAEAAREAKKLESERQQSVLAKIKRMIEKTKIYATVDAQVVYATTGDGGWRFNREPLIEGSMVRERQDLICLPTTSSYLAEIKIHESSLEKISLDLPVRVTIDALPGKVFTGKVAKIAPLPDAGSMWMNPDMKVYNTEIHLDEGDANLENLRTGMSCRAEIFVDRYPDAIYVPVQSILRVNNVPTVYIATPKGPERRTIKLGLDNNSMARVLDGLKVGEKVMLAPPLGEAQTTEEAAAGRGADIKFPVGPTTRPIVQIRPAGKAANGGAGRGDAATGNGAPDAGAARGGAEGAGAGRTLTAEQREALRKRMESMTPEEREAMRGQRRPGGGGGQGGGGEGGGGGGGGRRGSGGPNPPAGGPQ